MAGAPSPVLFTAAPHISGKGTYIKSNLTLNVLILHLQVPKSFKSQLKAPLPAWSSLINQSPLLQACSPRSNAASWTAIMYSLKAISTESIFIGLFRLFPVILALPLFVDTSQVREEQQFSLSTIMPNPQLGTIYRLSLLISARVLWAMN